MAPTDLVILDVGFVEQTALRLADSVWGKTNNVLWDSFYMYKEESMRRWHHLHSRSHQGAEIAPTQLLSLGRFQLSLQRCSPNYNRSQ
jgi:hypothetical protein